MPKVSIIVLQYNQSDRTLACLESLAKLTYPTFNVIVVDNGSDVQHLKAIEYWIEMNKALGFKLKAISKNLGYSGGNNIGIREALKDGNNDYILILNNDIVVEPDFLGQMVSVMNYRAGIKVVGVEYGTMQWLRTELPLSRKAPSSNELQKNQYLSGLALLVYRGIFKEDHTNGFDERYFLYFEDVDFTFRVSPQYSYKLGIAQAKYQHAVSATTKSLGSATLLYYHTRNALLFNKTHGPWWVQLALPFWAFWIRIKQHVKIALGRNSAESKAILKGVKDFYDSNWGGMRIK